MQLKESYVLNENNAAGRVPYQIGNSIAGVNAGRKRQRRERGGGGGFRGQLCCGTEYLFGTLPRTPKVCDRGEIWARDSCMNSILKFSNINSPRRSP